MHSHTKWFIALVALFAVGGFFFRPAKEAPAQEAVVYAESFEIQAEIADTPEERSLGLSGRPGLAADRGLLFVFDRAGLHSFWMKDMRFPIDIIWLVRRTPESGDADAVEAEIVHIERSVSPETYPFSFAPAAPADLVLETAAGFADANNLEVGKTLFIRR